MYLVTIDREFSDVTAYYLYDRWATSRQHCILYGVGTQHCLNQVILVTDTQHCVACCIIISILMSVSVMLVQIPSLSISVCHSMDIVLLDEFHYVTGVLQFSDTLSVHS